MLLWLRRLQTYIPTFCTFLLALIAPHISSASAWEKHLLVLPLVASDQAARNAVWFGTAFRDAYAQAFFSMNSIAFLKDDELTSLVKEYSLKLSQEPEPGIMEKIADDKELALIFGSFSIHKDTITINCHVIPGRGDDSHTFTVSGQKNQLKSLFKQALKESASALDIKPTDSIWEEWRSIPGTNSWTALEAYSQAQDFIRAFYGSTETVVKHQKAILALERSVQADKTFVSAIAQKISFQLLKPNSDIKTHQQFLINAQKDIEHALKLEPTNPHLENARLDILLQNRQYKQAIELGSRFIQQHGTNYRNYLLLGRAFLAIDQWSEAEKILMSALAQQGTALQKKPFNLELGMLLLNHKDKLSENFLQEVIKLEPKNAELHYWRAVALFNIGRWLDTMDEIQIMENLKKTSELKQLKAKTTLALGNEYFKTNDLTRAFTFTSMAVKLRPLHFETNLLMAKVLRKKGYLDEARKQLEIAKSVADNQRGKDHFILGTEYIAQGLKEEGAQEYVAYLKLNPNAPERTQLIQYIRKLRGTETTDGVEDKE